MLTNKSRSLLREHNLSYIEKKHPNFPQLNLRWKKQSKNSLYDLNLLSKKMPEEFVYDVFTKNTLGPLMAHILDTREDELIKKKLDSKRTDLAIEIAAICIKFCATQLEILFKDTPSLIEPVVSNLMTTISNCRDLGNKLDILELENKLEGRDLIFLFDWSKFPGIHERRVKEFLFEQTGDPVTKILNIKKKMPLTGVSFRVEVEPDAIWNIEIDILDNTKAMLNIFDEDFVDTVKTIPMHIKSQHDTVLFYYKK